MCMPGQQQMLCLSGQGQHDCALKPYSLQRTYDTTMHVISVAVGCKSNLYGICQLTLTLRIHWGHNDAMISAALEMITSFCHGHD